MQSFLFIKYLILTWSTTFVIVNISYLIFHPRCNFACSIFSSLFSCLDLVWLARFWSSILPSTTDKSISDISKGGISHGCLDSSDKFGEIHGSVIFNEFGLDWIHFPVEFETKSSSRLIWFKNYCYFISFSFIVLVMFYNWFQQNVSPSTVILKGDLWQVQSELQV